MVSNVEFSYYQQSKGDEFSYHQQSRGDEFTFNQLYDIVSTQDTSNGRCYSITPTSEMIKKGIKYVELELVSLTKISIHTPGINEYQEDTIKIRNYMGFKEYYRVKHELLEMLHDKYEPCNDTPNYVKDHCAQNEIERFVLNEYGCIPPFFENKKNICSNETISKQVYEYWYAARYYTNCSDPCKEIMVSANWMMQRVKQGSELKFYFQNRVKVVKSYRAYSSLSLIAEIGSYIGLFLGVSFNQIPHYLSFVQQRVQKYFH